MYFYRECHASAYNNRMNTMERQTVSAIKAVRKEMLKALENASRKVLAIFPDAQKSLPAAQRALNILSSQAQESLELFSRQFTQELNDSLESEWIARAESEIDAVVAELEAA